MKNNIKSRAYNFSYCPNLPFSAVQGVKKNGEVIYLNLYDAISGIVRRGGMERRPARPTLEELKAQGIIA